MRHLNSHYLLFFCLSGLIGINFKCQYHMRSEHQSVARFQDIDLSSHRHPVVAELEAALLMRKPVNPIHFIKTWAMKQLKETHESDADQPEEATFNKKKRMTQLQKRRGAIVMARVAETEHWKQFLLKESLPKNEQCKSRVMIGLRSVPFLQRLEWDDINYLVELGEVREYYQNEVFVAKDQMIDRLYILISGEIKRKNSQGPSVLYGQGSHLFADSLVSNLKSANAYTIVTQKAWICGIQAYAIHQRLRQANQRREQCLQRMLMNVGMFTCLDNDEMYKLILMVKELPPFKADQIILEKEEPVSRLYLVMKGEFSLCRKNLSGDIAALQTFREGQFFDEEWIKAKTLSEVVVIARTDGVLNYIQRDSIEEGIAKIEHLVLRKKAKKSLK